MKEWQEGYRYSRAGENAVMALIAAHHRLAWIHPFVDGNGRTVRLHTHLGPSSLGLTQGLCSPIRGLARAQESYYAHLIEADRERQGDYDGRGVLTGKGLLEFIGFFMNICIEQIKFSDINNNPNGGRRCAFPPYRSHSRKKYNPTHNAPPTAYSCQVFEIAYGYSISAIPIHLV